jgi:hypothetical protein
LIEDEFEEKYWHDQLMLQNFLPQPDYTQFKKMNLYDPYFAVNVITDGILMLRHDFWAQLLDKQLEDQYDFIN